MTRYPLSADGHSAAQQAEGADEQVRAKVLLRNAEGIPAWTAPLLLPPDSTNAVLTVCSAYGLTVTTPRMF